MEACKGVAGQGCLAEIVYRSTSNNRGPAHGSPSRKFNLPKEPVAVDWGR